MSRASIPPPACAAPPPYLLRPPSPSGYSVGWVVDRMADAAVRRFAGRDLAGREALGLMREAAGQPEALLRRLLAEDLPAMVVYRTGPHGRPRYCQVEGLGYRLGDRAARAPHLPGGRCPH